MLKNYLKIAIRNLWRTKGFSAINIFGMAVGFATCLLISLFVIDELSYDKYNDKAERIFRFQTDLHIAGTSYSALTAPAPLGPTIVKDYPRIEKFVRIANTGDMLVKDDKSNQTIMEKGATFTDSTFFEIFSVPLITGDTKTALKEPLSMVISESMAKKYFRSTDVIGKTLLTSNTITYKITGVMKDMPAQSHFHFNFLKSMSELEDSRSQNWLSNNYITYVLVRKGVDAKEIDGYMKSMIIKYMGPQMVSILHSTLNELETKGDYFKYTSMPLLKIHLNSHYNEEFEANGNTQYIYIFTVVAIFILLIACFNFINLSTARSAGRSKEVGVRKVLGSQRSNLIFQFISESIVTSFISLLLAVIIAALMLPYFNQLSGKQISLGLISNLWLIPVLLLATLIVGLMAGSYPAFYMSAFQPIQTLKGKLSSGFKKSSLRNGLVVFQFTSAILLIVGTLVIYSQLNYIRNKDLGYNREQVMTLQNTYSLWVHAKSFKDEVLKIPGVVGGTMTRNLPNAGNYNTNGFFKDASMRATESVIISNWYVDADYIPTLGMKLVKGRNFSPLLPTDSSCIIINETTALSLGYADPLNKIIYRPGSNDEPVACRIIGVVKDFHSTSLHNKIEPIMLMLGEERGAMSFRINSKNIRGVIAQIKAKYSAVEKMAGQPFLYSFMDDDFNRLYHADQLTGQVFISFAVLAILIACLGLFGLVTYAAEQRVKEIGIRKVLGATIGSIVGLLSKDFLKLISIALLIAFPLAGWAMSQWLKDFVYQVKIGWWVFAVAGLSVLMIALITVSFRAIKASLMNPVKSLRSE